MLVRKFGGLENNHFVWWRGVLPGQRDQRQRNKYTANHTCLVISSLPTISNFQNPCITSQNQEPQEFHACNTGDIPNASLLITIPAFDLLVS